MSASKQESNQGGETKEGSKEKQELKELLVEIRKTKQDLEQAEQDENITDTKMFREKYFKLISRKKKLEFDINLEKMTFDEVNNELIIIEEKLKKRTKSSKSCGDKRTYANENEAY